MHGAPKKRWTRRTFAFLVDFAIVHLLVWLVFVQVAERVLAPHEVTHDVEYPWFGVEVDYGTGIPDSDVADMEYEAGEDAAERLVTWWYPAWFVLAAVFYGFFETLGASPGKWLFRLRVRRMDGRRWIGWRAFARNLTKASFAPVLLPWPFSGWLLLAWIILVPYVVANLAAVWLPLILDVRKGPTGQRWMDARLGLALLHRNDAT